LGIHRFDVVMAEEDGRRAVVSADCAKFLGPEFLSTRRGPGNSSLNYVQGVHIIRIANLIFGYDGWSSEVKRTEVKYLDRDDRACWSAGVAAIVRVTLIKEGCFHEDVGHGIGEGTKNKLLAIEKAEKEACTDALKRALRQFGDALGNCVYDKDYLQLVKDVKGSYKALEFNEEQLYRLNTKKDRGGAASMFVGDVNGSGGWDNVMVGSSFTAGKAENKRAVNGELVG
jgi:DNA repair and recombination protein RAD52